MLKLKSKIKVLLSAGFVACFSLSIAQGADLAERRTVCREGYVVDEATGQAVLDRTKKDPTPIRCGPVADTEFDPGLALGGLAVAAGLGVGICGAVGCFNHGNPPPIIYPVSP